MNEKTIPGEFDCQVQAYVDGELAAEERTEFRRRLRSSPALRAELERLSAMRRCLQEAFPASPVPAAPRVQPARSWSTAAALLVGLALGFLAAQFASDGGARNLTAFDSGNEMTRVLLHVGSGDADAMGEALTSARYILDDFAELGRAVRVHVVANGPGLDIYRPGVTLFAKQIDEMERAYPNIQFVACQNTIERVEKRTQQPVALLPGVLRVDSGVADIARKRASGWLYIGV
ncbi:MAG: hypothetical protein DWQ08_11010 [Proteobacteria bacterium]|nr:MAG: hypothetical protein DWQ08_11010 [Pseudomonadota bacterium]